MAVPIYRDYLFYLIRNINVTTRQLELFIQSLDYAAPRYTMTPPIQTAYDPYHLEYYM